MDAVMFLKERSRMYEIGGVAPRIGLDDDYDPAIVVEVVEKWSAAHPRKTRQSVFLEQYQETALDGYGVITICPTTLSKAHRNSSGGCKNPYDRCDDCRREFWMREVE